ncbi:hypothetical protein [Streptomyces marispadix]|uniref:Transferase n=1 Tax=Streptomyces marispadix TaxID=2922868 RepID=A0ABS9STJ5_9ACTN|nr:hypothetical protein [Streptomyces marispadix]MCH6159503.1 hypothetical protein [Streptomyces marispadix]
MSTHVTGGPGAIRKARTANGRLRKGSSATPPLPSRLAPHTASPRPSAAPASVPSSSASPPSPVPPHPRADCTADSAGGLTFDVRLGDVLPAGSGAGPDAGPDEGPEEGLTGGAPAARPPDDAALLLRLRDGEGPSGTVRLPLAPAESEGTLRAVLPSIMSLPEGRWDAYLALGDEEPRRLLPGVHDLRSLIGRVPREGRTWLGVRIPYATKYGNLTVRSWLRWPHAEAGPLEVANGSVALRGTLHGARLSATATLEAHPRDPAAAPVSVPLHEDACDRRDGPSARSGHGTPVRPGHGTSAQPDHGGTVRTEHSGPAPRFTARLPLEALPSPSGPRVWDLWVRPAAGEEPVRLARILDDVPDKKRIFSYPPQRVTAADGSAVSVRPYYTLDNDLSIRVSCAEPV